MRYLPKSDTERREEEWIWFLPDGPVQRPGLLGGLRPHSPALDLDTLERCLQFLLGSGCPVSAAGFAQVFDTNFTADLTIMEEAHELLKRLEGAGPCPCSPRAAPAGSASWRSSIPS